MALGCPGLRTTRVLTAEKETTEQRIASGEPFTYGQLTQLNPNEAKDRIVDRTLQRWRKAQLITFTREGHQTFWSLTELGRQAAPCQRGEWRCRRARPLVAAQAPLADLRAHQLPAECAQRLTLAQAAKGGLWYDPLAELVDLMALATYVELNRPRAKSLAFRSPWPATLQPIP